MDDGSNYSYANVLAKLGYGAPPPPALPTTISSDDYQPPADPSGENSFIDQSIRKMTAANTKAQAMSVAPSSLPQTSDDIQGYPEMPAAHKYALYLSNLLAGNLPSGQRSVDSPAMKNIINDYNQQTLTPQMMQKMQSAQPGYYARHPEIKPPDQEI